MQLDNPFFSIVAEGCHDQASVMDDVVCHFVGPKDNDKEMQLSMLRDLIHSNHTIKIDGIAIAASSTETLAPAIDEGIALGVPIITFDSDVPSSKRLSYVGTDNFFFEQELAKVLMQLRPEGGRYAILYSPEPNILERAQGFEHQMAQHARMHNLPKLWVSAGWANFGDNLTLSAEFMYDFVESQNVTAIVPMRGAPMRSCCWKNFVKAHPEVTLVSGDDLPNQLKLFSRNYVHGLVGQLPYEMGQFSITTLCDIVRLREQQQKGLLVDRTTLSSDSFVGTNVLTPSKTTRAPCGREPYWKTEGFGSHFVLCCGRIMSGAHTVDIPSAPLARRANCPTNVLVTYHCRRPHYVLRPHTTIHGL